MTGLTKLAPTITALGHERDILHRVSPRGRIVDSDNHWGKLLPYFNSTVQELLVVIGSICVRPGQAPCPV